MKKIVLLYGTISGLIASCLMIVSILIEKKAGFGNNSVILDYSGFILPYIPLFMGIRAYRQTIGAGYITFLKALNVGIVIVVISSIFTTVSWLAANYWIMPDFADKYTVFFVQQIKASGKDLKDTLAVKQQMAQYKELAKNPLIFAAYTFPESLPLGIILTLICAAFLRKKPPAIQEAMEVTEESESPT